MVFDWDDYGLDWSIDNHTLLWLGKLRKTRSDFRCTLFAVPGGHDEWYWDALPVWIELALHGSEHPTPTECADWTADRMREAIRNKPPQFANLWKSPGWQTSDGIYEALAEAGWAMADQPYNDGRRPSGLRVHLLGQPDHWHGHVQNVCGNGLEETWDEVVALVKAAPSFEFMSEVVQPWAPAPVAA